MWGTFASQARRVALLAGGLVAAAGFAPAAEAGPLKGKLFFSANDGARGTEVWRTDGTRGGTKFLANVNPGDDDGFPGPDGSFPSGFTRLGGHVYFAANDGVRGLELWRTDGTKAGTRLFKDIDPGDDDGMAGPDSSSPSGLTKLGGRLYFGANDGTDGSELWRTNGRRKGTRLVKDIFPGSVGSAPSNLLRRGKRLYFRANDGVGGAEPWRSDGTRQGTKRLHDINPGLPSSLPAGFMALGKRIFFAANDGARGIEPWKTTGKPGGAKLLKNISPGSDSSAPGTFARLGSRLYFAADDAARGRELWKTDGSGGGTKPVKDIDPGDDDAFPGPDDSAPFDLVSLGNRVYFSASDGTRGRELWRTDGRAKGTRLVRNIVPGSNGSFPCQLVRLGDRLLFGALTPGHGFELWRSDGSRDGTRLLKEISPGPGSGNPFGCD